MLDAVGGQLVFNDGGILILFDGLQEIGLVHPIEVVVFGKKHVRRIGGYAGPGGFFLGLFVILEEFEHARVEVVFEVKGAFYLLGRCVGFFFLHVVLFFVLFFIFFREFTFDLKTNGGFFVDELQAGDVQVLGVEGVFGQARHVGGHFYIVKKDFFELFRGVNQVIGSPLAGFVGIPKTFTLLEPVGADTGGEHHFFNFGGGKTGGQVVIGFGKGFVLG